MNTSEKTLLTVATRGVISVIEIVGTASERRYHVVEWDAYSGQVRTAIDADRPNRDRRCSTWVASRTAFGVAYVSRGRTRRTALRWMNRLAKEAADAQ